MWAHALGDNTHAHTLAYAPTHPPRQPLSTQSRTHITPPTPTYTHACLLIRTHCLYLYVLILWDENGANTRTCLYFLFLNKHACQLPHPNVHTFPYNPDTIHVGCMQHCAHKPRGLAINSTGGRPLHFTSSQTP